MENLQRKVYKIRLSVRWGGKGRKFNTFLLAFGRFKSTKYKIADKVSLKIPYRLILLLLRCLEVVYRLYSADYLCGRLDVLNDLIHRLVGHR